MEKWSYMIRVGDPMNDERLISVGDAVMWRGDWGNDLPQKAKIVHMELCAREREKYGIKVEKAYFVDKNRLMVVLDNDKWAYGFQIEPIDKYAE